MRSLLGWLILSFALWPLAASTAETTPVEGIDYALIVPPLPGGTGGSVEVQEYFWYGCPHCYAFEPALKRWIRTRPSYVVFDRVPAIFTNPAWELHARAYYTAEALGVLDKMSDRLFNAIHEQRRRLATERDLAEFFEESAVPRDSFQQTFNSFVVQSKVGRAKDLSRSAGLTGVPAMVVNGKYRVDGQMAGSNERMLAIVDFLAKKEFEAQRPKKKH